MVLGNARRGRPKLLVSVTDRSPVRSVPVDCTPPRKRNIRVTPANDPLETFGVTVRFDSGRVVLGVRGEVDMLSAPELAAVLDAVLGRGHTSVVLDVAELDFMDASGLGVIASSASRLDPLGGEITIRSAPALLTRILDITGLNGAVRFEDRVERSEPTSAHLGPVTGVPADLDVVDGALRLVVALAQATVKAADGVSVSLRRHGRLLTVAATDQTVSDMDADQYATGEGPCVSASIEGRQFYVESVDEETRWPAFTPRATNLGINAILSSPLTARERPIGALNIYSRTRGAFSETEQQLAGVFAVEASAILSDAGADVTEGELSDRMNEALHARRVIAQAEGVVMEREGISGDDAYRLLLNIARSGERSLVERATDVMDSTRRTLGRLPGETEGP
jgi:anti-anti-sigma factor